MAVLPLAALILEGGVRLAAPQQVENIQYKDIFTKRYSPSLRGMVQALVPGIVRSLWGKEVRINSAGNRDYEYAREKAPDVQRIAIIGSSETFGFALAIEDTFAKILERKLKGEDERARYEVLAFGRPGFTVKDVYAYVMDEVFSYAPDVLIYSFVQIAYEETSPRQVLDSAGGGTAPQAQEKNRTPSPLTRVRRQFARVKQTWPIRPIVRHSHLYLFTANSAARLMREVFPGEKEKGQSLEALEPDSPQFRRRQATTQKWLALLAQECSRRNVRFAVMVLPYEMQLSRTGAERWRARGIKVPEDSLSMKAHTFLRGFAEETEGVFFIDVVPDLRTAVERGGKLFLTGDYGHFNREGNEIIADVLRRWYGEVAFGRRR